MAKKINLEHSPNCYLHTGGAPVEPCCTCGAQDAIDENRVNEQAGRTEAENECCVLRGEVNRLIAENVKLKVEALEEIGGWKRKDRLLQAELKAKDKDLIKYLRVIQDYARHKHGCKTGEYNTIKIVKGCDCGLSKALKGE